MRLSPYSLRFRLLLAYLAVAAIFSGGASVWFYLRSQNNSTINRTRQVREVVHWAVSQSEPRGELTVQDLDTVAAALSGSPVPDFSFFLLSSEGAYVRPLGVGDPNFSSTPLRSSSIARAVQERREATFVVRAQDRQYRTLVDVFPVVSPTGSLMGAIQAEARLDEADIALARLRNDLIVGVVGLLVAACLLWYLAIRATLRPLGELARVSRAVGRGELGLRVAVPRGKDETREMALVFNATLDQIEALLEHERHRQRDMQRFFADISHELRSPLTILGGYIGVLSRGGKDDPAVVTEALMAMRATVERLTRLTDDLVTLSRLEAGSGLTLDDVEVNAVCQECCQMVQVTAGEREVSFVSSGRLTIKADREVLGRAISNLLDNAVRYTGPRGKIVLSVWATEDECCITVADDGMGIAPEHLPRVFDRFYRVNKTPAEGVGLGLAITKAAVEAHGGHIAVESALGRGTTFAITLPRGS